MTLFSALRRSVMCAVSEVIDPSFLYVYMKCRIALFCMDCSRVCCVGCSMQYIGYA